MNSFNHSCVTNVVTVFSLFSRIFNFYKCPSPHHHHHATRKKRRQLIKKSYQTNCVKLYESEFLLFSVLLMMMIPGWSMELWHNSLQTKLVTQIYYNRMVLIINEWYGKRTISIQSGGIRILNWNSLRIHWEFEEKGENRLIENRQGWIV